jgi:DNA-binding transcriptional MerR regulator
MMTRLTLRYYHRVGLLEPADVDPDTGYRGYDTDQIPAAQIIRGFRNLDMPVEEVKQVLAAPDIQTRNENPMARPAVSTRPSCSPTDSARPRSWCPAPVHCGPWAG